MRRNLHFKIRSDINLPPERMNHIFLELAPFENRMLARRPFGSSRLLLGRKKSR
jgi:hypothetical protein